MIALTGDLIDDKTNDVEKLRDFVTALLDIAPVYFVSGNNELTSGKYEQLKTMLISIGIRELEDEAVTVVYDNSSFNLIGLRDPSFIDGLSTMPEDSTLDTMQSTISELTTEGLDIMLAHRPSIISTYAASDVELVLTGHAHGGQVRLPFIGGLVSPDEGLFPEYTEGLYTLENTTMIISRGLGNSVIPLRVFNRPEIVVIDLKAV
jgi:predicted MPP superfamily phosphohydrolase